MGKRIRPKIKLTALAAVLTALFVLQGCKPKVMKKNGARIFPVVASAAYKGDIEHIVRLNGEIKGQNQADIYPDVTGKVQNLMVREGQRVYAGQIVAYVDRSQVGMKFMPASVTSPISGVVGKIYVDRGQTVSMQTPVMMVADTRFVEGVLNIPEKFVPLFRIGQQAEIRTESWPGKVFKGRVYKVASLIDPTTRTLRVRLRLLNLRGRLIPGNYADFAVKVRKYPDQVLVPFDAIIDTLEFTEVFVIKEKKIKEKPMYPGMKSPLKSKGGNKSGKKALKPIKDKNPTIKPKTKTVFIAVKRRVTVGIREGNVVQVLSGLKPGERVVTMGKENLVDGSLLKLKKMATEKESGSTGETR